MCSFHLKPQLAVHHPPAEKRSAQTGGNNGHVEINTKPQTQQRQERSVSVCIVQSRSKLRYSRSRSLTDGSVKPSKQLEVVVGIPSASNIAVIFQLGVKRAIFPRRSSCRTNTDLNYWMSRSVTRPTWVPSANMEGIMSCTAAHHQGASRCFWPHYLYLQYHAFNNTPPPPHLNQ